MKAILVCLALLLAAPAAAADGNTCRRLPSGKRVVKLTLKPDTEIGDLVSWISSVTCRTFLLPSTIDSHRKVTIIAPQTITADEAFQLFLDALDSVNLTAVRIGTFWRVIETSAAKSSPVPFYVDR